MALTAQQKLQIKKHLEVPPTALVLDHLIATLEDGGPLEAELTTALTACNTARTNWETALSQADELTAGEGARFNYSVPIAAKKKLYREAVKYLEQLLGFPHPQKGNVLGFFSS